MFEAAVARLESVLITPEASITEAMARLEAAGTGALVIAGPDRRLKGIVTDGDIRRAILARVPLHEQCGTIATRKPLAVHSEATAAEALHLLDCGRGTFFNNAPVVDENGVVVGLLLRKDLGAGYAASPLSAVIMAGGFGKRLLPLTESVPKPMLPVGDRPLLQRTIERLHAAGIERAVIATHHLGQQISDYFGDGSAYGVQLEYSSEEHPLGTAGALRSLKQPTETLLVINGDILTGVDFQQMLAFHHEQGGDVTVGLRRCELEVPYGVLSCDGPHVTGLEEKPRSAFLINAGIYMVESSVLRYIPRGRSFDMTDLVRRLLEKGRPVVGFPIHEYWLDIGTLADYEQSHRDVIRANV